MKIRRIDRSVIVFTVAALFSASLGAQQQVLEEVTVTAERRAESIQDVPLSVVAISGEDVEVGKITGMNDIAFKTPGLTFNQFNIGEPRIYIRGIGNSSDSAGSDQAVGVFIDEVYIGRTGGVTRDLFDLERVEVLRGPQGTLYGKNTNGGAINFVTTRPSQEFEARVRASIGNYGMTHVQALLNGRMTDTLSGKLVISHQQRDGFGKNVITQDEIATLGDLSKSPIIRGSTGADGGGDELDDAENFSARGQVLWDISDDTELLLSLDYARDQSNGACRHLLNLDEAIGGTGPFWALGLSDTYLADERHCATQFNTEQDREIRGAMARLDSNWDWATFTSITAWRESDYTFVDDLTGIPLNDLDAPAPPGLPFPLNLPGIWTPPENVIDGVAEDASQISQEFRLTGGRDSVDWVAGLFYMKEEVNRDEEYYTQYSTLLQVGFSLAGIGDVLFTQDNTTKSTAAYGQIDWHVTDRWTLTYGLRWSDDEKDIVQNSIDLLGTGFPTGVPLILPEFPGPVTASDSWSEVTQKAGVTFNPTDSMMFYATYSEGFKSGAFPSQANTVAAATATVDPETVQNFELGFKSNWWNNRVQFNAVYYTMDYDDLQVFELNRQLLLVLGTAQAESDGWEVEFNILPIDNLSITSRFSSGDAKYTDYINANGVDVSGNKLPFAPDNAASIDVNYYLPVSGGSALDFSVAYDWKDDYYFVSSNAEKTRQDAVGLLSASVTWTSSDQTWDVMLWGKNLTDELQLSSLIVDPTQITSEFYMPPRTYGVSVSKSWQ